MSSINAAKQPRYLLHATRVILIGVAIIAVGFVKSDAEPLTRSIQTSQSPSHVLAFAANMNQADLYNATNAARTQNGLAPFTLSTKLSSAAQMKANDMIAKNYWSHVAPDGTQPWYWFEQAGYNYRNAGENLAYGFDTGYEVVDGWMNSPGHRANILGSFYDVGFGYAQGENYQGGRNTVVVGLYGTSSSTTTTPPAPPATPTDPIPPSLNIPVPSASSAPTQAPQSSNNPAPTPSPTTAPSTAPPSSAQAHEETPSTTTPSTSTPDASSSAVTTNKTEVSTPVIPSAVTVAGQLLRGSLPTIVITGLILLSLVAASFIATHVALFRHSLAAGEQYVLHHPAIDMTVLAVAAVLILTTQIGRIG